ncbi:SPC25 [Candida pseudojiufengensis]|uniref:SPC25 n=1 Tax=Candida pseudojiufengensis TaxID=497109 RepID=UPI0022257412|nr:SPC25 [Candida pseudojiufengensis]KAI5962620.1 SPC25 [Candida pseudojiufengensis]
MSQSKIDQAFNSFQKQTNEFENLKLNMEEFINDLDLKLSNKQISYLNQQQQFKTNLQELNKIVKSLQNEINQLNEKELNTTNKLNDSLKNLQLSNSKIEELQLQKTKLLDQKQNLENQIDNLRFQIKQGENQLEKTHKIFENQFKLNLIELSKYELYTGLKIKPQQNNEITFSFFNLNSKNIDEEYSIKLDINDDNYKYLETSPNLSKELVDELIVQLNQHQKLIKLLKEIRNLFKNYIDEENKIR